MHHHVYTERPTTPREQIELSHRARTLRGGWQLETIRARAEAVSAQPGNEPTTVEGNLGWFGQFTRLRQRNRRESPNPAVRPAC